MSYRPSQPTPEPSDSPTASREAARETVVLKPCQDGNLAHHLIEVDAAITNALGLPAGALLHLDTHRRPKSGDVVLAEVVVREHLTRTVRRYTSVGPPAGGIVGLAPLAGQAAAPSATPPASLIRPRYEVGIVGVVDGHVVPLAES